MDVFKLLARSNKSAQTKPAQNSPAQRLPSSGAVANPQLFGRDESTRVKTGRKRKRGQDRVEGPPSPAGVPADLDFFGGGRGRTVGGEKIKQRREEEERAKVDEDMNGGSVIEWDDGEYDEAEGRRLLEETEAEAYDLDECKRILHSHKLKVALMEDFAPQVEALPEEKKKSKKRKKGKEEKQKKKDTKQPLYPQPLTSFAQLRTRYRISRRLAENIAEQGYKLPTEVQLGALPLLLDKKEEYTATDSSGSHYGGDIDLLTVAPTGSGKTIAFLIPILNALLAEGKTVHGQDGPRAIVLAPTRELASQIVNEARKLAKGTGIKATLMRKGMQVVEAPEEQVNGHVQGTPVVSEDDEDASDNHAESQVADTVKPTQRRAELVKAAILVATPLALLNALKRRDSTIAALPAVSRLVLDEADVLLDPLFRDQTLAIWTACNNPNLRMGLWSATMGSNIESLTISTLNTRWSSLISSSLTTLPPRPPLLRLVVGLKDSAIPNISHQLTYAATEAGKLLGLRQLLHPSASSPTPNQPSLRPPFLVFTQTIPRAIALHSELRYDIPPEAGGSTRIAVLHADLSSSARDAIMTRFRRGDIWLLITTDLLARGVDFRGLNGVVNYDVPTSAAGYVHRVGRTGRAGRAGGVAVTLYTHEDVPYVKLIANVIRASEKMRGVKDGEGSVKQWLLDALPTPSKRERKELKMKGVEARRRVKDKDGKGTARISTKSGYVRRVENRRRGARVGSQRREAVDMGERGREEQSGEESDGFEGFED